MEPDRNTNGSFTQGLGGLGANPHEQHASGVNHLDNEYTAGAKIIQARGNATQQAIASGAYSGPLFFFSAKQWLILLFNLFLIGLAVQSGADFYSRNSYFAPRYLPVVKEERVSPTGRKSLGVLRKSYETRIGSLFRADAPLSKIWLTCEHNDCDEIGINSLKAFSQFAVNPPTLEHDFCVKVKGADNSDRNGDPLYRINGESGACEMSNEAEVVARVNRHNSFYDILLWIWLGACLSVILFANYWLVWRRSWWRTVG